VTRPGQRLRAFLGTGLFLVGVLGLPLTDAALFHRAGHDPYAGTTHFEGQGGDHHADRCALDKPVLPQRESLGSNGIVREAAPVAVRIALPASLAPVSIQVVTLHHSRAPPA